ncbi:MAG TPA: type IV pilin protein [Steroidobacteraceae bacterium]|nr:type IV pilin protein [Steroidobacteraceae bacterium]
MKQRQRGVTLMELLTVMVVLAIIASIAIPSYRKYLLRAQRADAKTALLQAQTAQEKYVLQNNAYTTLVTTGTNAIPPGLGLTGVSEHGYYTITVDAGLTNTDGTPGYTIRALPVMAGPTSAQKDDADCVVFTIDAAGARTALNSGGANNFTTCWAK